MVILALIVRYALPKPYNRAGLVLLSLIFVYSYSVGSLLTLVAAAFAGYLGQYPWKKRRIAGIVSTISIIIILLLLFVYNYFSFTSSFLVFLRPAYDSFRTSAFGLFVPVGLSFYSLSIIGSVIDSVRGKYAEKDPLTYILFATWFPQILSGPIARSDKLSPQFRDLPPYVFDNLRDGLIRFVFGAYIKYTLADVLSAAVLTQYDENTVIIATGSGLLIATVFYSIQIYADFLAYTWMVRGLSQMFGIELNINFNAPYTSFSIREFWRRWHISLSSWLREYVYFSLGGSRKGQIRTCINTLIVFIVSGLWHGASYNYLIWGLLHGFYLVFGVIISSPRKKIEEKIGGNVVYKAFEWLITFSLVSFAWIFFRAPSLSKALYIVSKLLDSVSLKEMFSAGFLSRFSISDTSWIVALITFDVLVVSDIIQNRKQKDIPDLISKSPAWLRLIVCYAVAAVILFWGSVGSSQFIYFQF